MCPDWESNWRPFVLCDDAHPTKPLRRGQWAYLKLIQLEVSRTQTQFLFQSSSLHLILLHLTCNLDTARIMSWLPSHNGQIQLYPDVTLCPFPGCGSLTSCPHALNPLFRRSRQIPRAFRTCRLLKDSNTQAWKPPLPTSCPPRLFVGKSSDHLLVVSFSLTAFQREKLDTIASEKSGCQTNDDLNFAARVYKVSFCSHCLWLTSLLPSRPPGVLTPLGSPTPSQHQSCLAVMPDRK